MCRNCKYVETWGNGENGEFVEMQENEENRKFVEMQENGECVEMQVKWRKQQLSV